jgi:hypothetical protein
MSPISAPKTSSQQTPDPSTPDDQSQYDLADGWASQDQWLPDGANYQSFNLSDGLAPVEASMVPNTINPSASEPTFNPSDVVSPRFPVTKTEDWQIDPMLLPTPGLSAFPGGMHEPFNQYPQVPQGQYFQGQHQSMYPDPNWAYAPSGVPYHYGGTGYTPIDQQFVQQPMYPHPPLPTTQKKRSRVDSDSEDNAPIIKRRRRSPQPITDDSDSDAPVIKPTKAAKSSTHNGPRRQSRDSGVSSSSSLGKPVKTLAAQAGQKPQKPEEKPWIRINNNTRGETTRTARINEEANQLRKYKHKPLPHGDWECGKYKFEYTSYGGLDEFKKKKMPARQIQEYITKYPGDELRLWLQVSPADVARRYGSPGHSKCLFENCPKHIWGDSGTIDVGHYRIAFDEKYKTWGNKVVDPFDCSGFAHLYCMERFLDFEAICQVTDVQVDTRVELPREAGQAKWTFSGRPELELAHHFIKAANKRNSVRETDAFRQYPMHISSSALKPFEHTLVNALAEINIPNRTRSQVRQFISRKLTPNVFVVNHGDLEVAMTIKKIKSSRVYKKATKSKRATATTFNLEAYYDEYDPIINQRINEWRRVKTRYDAEEADGTAPKKSQAGISKKRKVTAHDDDSSSDASLDDDSDVEFLDNGHGSGNGYKHHPYAPANRTSPRNRQRVDYSDADHHHGYVEAQQPQGRYPNQTPTHPRQPDQRTLSCTALFPTSQLGGELINIDDVLPQQPTAVEEEPLTQDQINALLSRYEQRRRSSTFANMLQRRRSSTLSHGPSYAGIMKSPRTPRSPRTPPAACTVGRSSRQASFNAQPVTSSKEFDRNDPPSALAATPTEGRRSARLASKSGSL